MTLIAIRDVLQWCFIINMGLLVWWFLLITVTHDWVYKMHSKWFKVSVEQFDLTHYAGIAFFKVIIMVFNLAPYIALCIVA